MTRDELTMLWGKVTGKIGSEIADLVDGAPAALDTLKEIADKLGDDDDAIAALVTEIAGKQDEDFVISLSGSGTTSSPYTINKTFSEISTAYNAGKTLILSDGSCVSNFTCYQGYRFLFHRFVENDSAKVIQYSIMTDSSVVKVEYELQEALVSGSSIKTVNGASVLGSGNINTSEVLVVTMTKSGNTCTADKSVSEIYQAYYTDKKAVIAVIPNHAGSGEYLLTACDPDADQYWFSSFQSNSCEVIAWNADTDYSYTISEKTFAEYSQLAAKQDALVSGTSIKTVNGTALLGSGDVDADDVVYFIEVSSKKHEVTYTWDSTQEQWETGVSESEITPKTGKLYVDVTTNYIYRWSAGSYVQVGGGSVTTDASPTQNSTNPVQSGGVYTALAGKQDALVSGTNIKTLNGASVLGSGDVVVKGVSDVSAPATADGTWTMTLDNGDTINMDLNHVHPQYLKYELVSALPASPDSGTLYLIAAE